MKKAVILLALAAWLAPALAENPVAMRATGKIRATMTGEIYPLTIPVGFRAEIPEQLMMFVREVYPDTFADLALEEVLVAEQETAIPAIQVHVETVGGETLTTYSAL